MSEKKMTCADLACAHRDLEARLRPFVARRIGTPADVDDVMQEVFLRVQRGLPGLRDNERLGPWLYRIARNVIGDYRRARARHPMARAAASELNAAPSELDGHDASDRIVQELEKCVAPFVRMLPSPYQEALTMTELEGLSQKDAAARAGVSLPGMKSRVQRGRERLREIFDTCCEIAVDARGRVISCEPRTNGTRPGPCCG